MSIQLTEETKQRSEFLKSKDLVEDIYSSQDIQIIDFKNNIITDDHIEIENE